MTRTRAVDTDADAMPIGATVAAKSGRRRSSAARRPLHTAQARRRRRARRRGRTLLPLDVQLVLQEVDSPEFQLVADPDGRTLRMRVECDGDVAPITAAVADGLPT